ncbi:Aldose 1-epimerase [termite gut metagenome]|uniref:aldose 1-epimerase n=1 Tax=termite gut metagenome TaxID=433724 RepID=A0A5J4QFD4_9ZZZZ
MKKLLFIGVIALLTSSCGGDKPELTLSGLAPKNFQAEINGAATNLYVLKNKAGIEVCITNFGARIVSVMVPDRNGELKDVVLGFDNITDYTKIDNNFGAAIGRYANRIKDGRFVIDGNTVQLPQNNNGHTLHGGPDGWDDRVYEAKPVNDTSIEMALVSPDGDANFPGKVTAKIIYTLTEDNAIDIRYEATTDKKTIINMTNHSYFNLSGNPEVPIMNDILYVNADRFTPMDATSIPTGEILSVGGTPMDFTIPKVIGADIDKYDYAQLKNGKGYDHNWVLNTEGDVTHLAASLISPLTGITLEVYTNEPGIQVYTGNFLNGTVKGKKGIVYQQRTAVCLETQHYPDSPNKPDWPSVILEPGQTYHSQCIYKFK